MNDSITTEEKPETSAEGDINLILRSVADKAFVKRSVGPARQTGDFRPCSLFEFSQGNDSGGQNGAASADDRQPKHVSLPESEHAASFPGSDFSNSDADTPDNDRINPLPESPHAYLALPDDSADENLALIAQSELATQNINQQIAAARQEGLETGRVEGLATAEKRLEQAITVLESVTERLFKTEAVDTTALTHSVQQAILSLAGERAGQAIDTLSEPFLKRVETLCDRVSKEAGIAKIRLNPDDLHSIMPHLEKSDLLQACQWSSTETLSRGDIEISADGIFLADILEPPDLVPEPTLDPTSESQS